MFSSNASAVRGDAIYIEDVFSTYLYTGNSSTQTITNGIDLSGKGGLVWLKKRTTVSPDIYSSVNHYLFDTARGNNVSLSTNLTNGNISGWSSLFGFNSSGFSITTSAHELNASASLYTSWTFREQRNFFDVVTYTGNGVFGREISHNLGAVPAFIIIKATSATTNWLVYTTAVDGSQDYLFLNTTDPKTDSSITTPWTSTTFPVGGSNLDNGNGITYVAYLFASNAGGFGLTGADNVITCGSYTGNASASGPSINLGYEPQWILIKNTTTSATSWVMVDNMRGMPVGSDDRLLRADLDSAEIGVEYLSPTATGFNITSNSTAVNASGAKMIYVAIRRGPMKTPTAGISVFSPNAYAGGTAGRSFSLGFVPDMLLTMRRNTSNFDIVNTRLLGQEYGFTNTTDSFQGGVAGIPAWDAPTNTISLSTATSVTGWNGSGSNYVNEAFRRAPGFFDVVCYTQNFGAMVKHNLGVVPELVIYKNRSNVDGVNTNWVVTSSLLGTFGTLNSNTAWGGSNTVANTATEFWDGYGVVYAGQEVAYLFASCPGVSKVGTYTGNGSSQTINCGFIGGARFVLIKRTDNTGDWYVWDTARGIVAANDSRLSLNTSAAEAYDDSIDPHTSGFIVNQIAATNINVSSATYIYLAIAGIQYDPNAGEVTYTTPGTYSWTAPAGVTSVSVVCVGGSGGGGGNGFDTTGAGGGGGGLGYKNNIAVTPGNSYTVVVGAGGENYFSQNGGDSYFISTSTVRGGGGGTVPLGGTSGGAGGTYTGDGGGNGGAGGGSNGTYGFDGGGGGAGGYSGTGGQGGYGDASGQSGFAGSGGGGGGGSGGGGWSSRNGGGVGLFGQGASGGASGLPADGIPGSGGSGYNYGGGGNGSSSNGYSGAVRIMWGAGRSFPLNAGSVL